MSESCQIDFYSLGSQALDESRLACKLAMMAWERGHRVAIVTSDVQALDELMWKYPEGRFLPHSAESDEHAEVAPVRILSVAPEDATDVVINLTPDAVREPARFSRLLEIVPHRPDEREASRKKFRAYRALGMEPHHHEIK